VAYAAGLVPIDGRRREELGPSQSAVAESIGVGLERVRADESGRTVPSLSRLRAYADLYSVDLVTVERGSVNL
jgi:transcriptional regulator with XRE-family HTH domain